MTTKMFSGPPYIAYCLTVLMLCNLMLQVNRFVLAIVAKPLAQELHFGDKVCMLNVSHVHLVPNKSGELGEELCGKRNESTCQTRDGLCAYNYFGGGYDYQILVGPVYILVFTFGGILSGLMADRFDRRFLLATFLSLWSAVTVLTSMVNEYWQLLALRLALGITQSGCAPFASSLIADWAPPSWRGAAMAFFELGVYTGFSLAYVVGNLVTHANFFGMGWRWAFAVAGAPGLILSLVMLATVREPTREGSFRRDAKEIASPTVTEETALSPVTNAPMNSKKREANRTDSFDDSFDDFDDDVEFSARPSLRAQVALFFRPAVLLLFLASAIRMGAGLCFAYNNQIYFHLIGQSYTDIAHWMSWVPATSGSLGCILGGIISDRLVPKIGVVGRILVIIFSLVIATPFAVGVFFLPVPYCYLSLIGNYMVGEMWIGVCLSAVIDVFPSRLRGVAVAVYIFVVLNVGGNMELVIPPLRAHFRDSWGMNEAEALKMALTITYPGMFVAAALVFIAALILFRCTDQASYPEWKERFWYSKPRISNPMGGSRLLGVDPDGRRVLTTSDLAEVPVVDLDRQTDNVDGTMERRRSSKRLGEYAEINAEELDPSPFASKRDSVRDLRRSSSSPRRPSSLARKDSVYADIDFSKMDAENDAGFSERPYFRRPSTRLGSTSTMPRGTSLSGGATLPRSVHYARVVSQTDEADFEGEDVILVPPASATPSASEAEGFNFDVKRQSSKPPLDNEDYYLQPVPSMESLDPLPVVPPKPRNSAFRSLDRRKIPRPIGPPPPPMPPETSCLPLPESTTTPSAPAPPLPPVGDNRRKKSTSDASQSLRRIPSNSSGPPLLGRPSSIHSNKSNSSDTNNGNKHVAPAVSIRPQIAPLPKPISVTSRPRSVDMLESLDRAPKTPPTPDLSFAYLLPNIVASPPQTSPPRPLSVEMSPLNRNISFDTFPSTGFSTFRRNSEQRNQQSDNHYDNNANQAFGGGGTMNRRKNIGPLQAPPSIPRI